MDRKEKIREWARAAGAAAVGVAPAGPMTAEKARLDEWLASGRAAGMAYLARPVPDRSDPSGLIAGARSVVCLAFPYNTPFPYSVEVPEQRGRGWISRHAWGEDYHVHVLRALAWLADMMASLAGGATASRLLCDTGPALEKALAARAGLGWIGKNTLLVHPRLGSWVFLGEIVTPLEIEPDSPVEDRCGDCRRCIETCPTGALVAPYVLDAGRCISYRTTATRAPFDETTRQTLGRHVYGCDLCQDACPWNEKAPRDETPAYFGPRNGLFHPEIAALRSLAPDSLRRLVGGGPMDHSGPEAFLRNLDAAALNAEGK